MAVQFAWLAGLLSFLAGFKKLFLWLGLAIPVVSHVLGWVGRIWSSVRNSLLGRFLRMAGMLSVAGMLSIAMGNAIFVIVGEVLQIVVPGTFQWPTNPVIHSMIGAADLLIPLTLIVDIMSLSVYLWLFCLAVRLGKYILTLTVG